MIYITADTHFSHTNIIKYCNRPFLNVNEMNEAILDNWNSVVWQKDTIYIAGDFMFNSKNNLYETTLKYLNGKKILIIGNHEKAAWQLQKKYHFFDEIKYYHEFSLNKQKIVLFHYPIEEWNGKAYNALHIHGHTHGNSRIIKNRYDIGVDTNNFIPILLEKIPDLIYWQNKKYKL